MPVGYRNLNEPCPNCQNNEDIREEEECRNYKGPHLITHRKDRCAVCGNKLKGKGEEDKDKQRKD